MTEDWTPEYDLTTDAVGAIVRANTQLPARRVKKLGEGWDFFCFIVDDRWVFRFPKRHREVEVLIAERTLLGTHA